LFTDNLDATEIPERTNVTRVAHLVGVPVQSLIDALTRKTIFAHGETVVCNENRVVQKKEKPIQFILCYGLRFRRCQETSR